jgi:hypothetical protein
MVILTDIIKENIKKIKSNCFLRGLNLGKFFKDHDNSVEFDTDFLQKLINFYTNKDNKCSDLDSDDEYQNESFGRFLKQLKDYQDLLISLEEKVVSLEQFYEEINSKFQGVIVYYANEENKLRCEDGESPWY